jgi:uncharacterized protein (TIGR03435 family)
LRGARKRTALGVIGFFVVFFPCCSKPQTDQRVLQFEVVSIRPSGESSVRGSDGGPGTKSSELFRFGRATLLDLIEMVWDIDRSRILSEKSLEKQQFDLTARVPEGTTKEQFKMMMRNMLADRFGMKIHADEKQFNVYGIVVAKTGTKLSKDQTLEGTNSESSASTGVADDVSWPKLPKDRPAITEQFINRAGFTIVRLQVQSEPLSVVADQMPRPDELFVIDKSGLPGTYSFRVEYAIGLSAAGPDDGVPDAPDVFTAFRQKLGLDLVKQKALLPVIAVDTFTESPTAN